MMEFRMVLDKGLCQMVWDSTQKRKELYLLSVAELERLGPAGLKKMVEESEKGVDLFSSVRRCISKSLEEGIAKEPRPEENLSLVVKAEPL